MTQFETYFLLFTDVLTSNFAFNISSEVVFDAMEIFGQYDKKLMVLVSITAYMLSFCINYLLGRICYNILAPTHNQEAVKASKMQDVRNSRFLPFIIILSAIPFFGKFIILFLGFCQIKFKRVFYIAILAKLIYYVAS